MYPIEHHIVPVNAEHPHGPLEEKAGAQFIALMIDKDLVEDVAFGIWGNRHIQFKEDFSHFSRNLEHLIFLFKEECRTEQSGKEFIIESLSVHLTVMLLRSINHNLAARTDITIPRATPNIRRAVEYLMDNYQLDYSLAEVAHIARLSPFHFARLFKQQIGRTPYEFLTDVKVDRACQLLRETHMSVTEICYNCGFNNLNHFDSTFKRKVGITPSRYRRET